MSFSVAEEEILINSIAKYTILYDANHADYRNALAKENAWKKIEQALGKSSEECKKKWKFIRDGYQRYKKKNKLGTGSAAPKNSKDKRHQQLSFLDDIPQHRSGGSNIAEPISQSECITPQETMGIEDASGDDEEERTGRNNLTEYQTKDNEKENIPEQRSRAKRIKRSMNDEKILKLWEDRDNKRQDLFKTIIQKKDDDAELFCRHIAEVLRNLPPTYKAEAKKEISILVSNYEIKAAQIPAQESRYTITDSISNSSSMSHYSSHNIAPYISPPSENNYAVPGPSNEISNYSYRSANYNEMREAYPRVNAASPRPTDLSYTMAQEAQDYGYLNSP